MSEPLEARGFRRGLLVGFAIGTAALLLTVAILRWGAW